MKNFNRKSKGLIFSLFAVTIIFIGAVLYEQGIITEDFYTVLLSYAQGENGISSDLEVHFIDVGQAECILIKAPEKTVLIDAGDVGYKKTIENYLRTERVYSIDLFIMTHPHADHIGSASDILKLFPTENVLMPEIPEEFLPTTTLFENLLITLSEEHCSVSYANIGDVYDLGGGAVLEILGPVDYIGSNLNNYSIISKLTYGETSFLFSGDAEKEAELSLINSGADISCDVLNAGHHGSSTSNSSLFLKLASPKYAAISCGYNNDYGHPHRETISSFMDFKIEYYRTDYDGSIVFASDGKNITVSTEKR